MLLFNLKSLRRLRRQLKGKCNFDTVLKEHSSKEKRLRLNWAKVADEIMVPETLKVVIFVDVMATMLEIVPRGTVVGVIAAMREGGVTREITIGAEGAEATTAEEVNKP